MNKKTTTVFLRTFGCQMNVRDSEVISGLLRNAGYEMTAEPDKADVILFNTCSVRQHAEDKVWSEIGRLKPPKIIVGLLGCMAQNYKEKTFQRAPDIDFAVGPGDIHKIPEIVKRIAEHKSGVLESNLLELKIWETEGRIRPEEIYHTGFYEDKQHGFVVISEGCSNYCSYCVVPYVRGELHNRKSKDILKEIEEATDLGITKITLLGQNVNAYQDDDVNFIKLIGLVNSVKGMKEFDFLTSHPKDTSLDLFKAMADTGKLKKNLHLPVQSGSDRILKLMNRGYTKKFYLGLTDSFKRIVKGGALTTDIIVGFPGETEEDFRDTYDLVKAAEFNSAYIFKYSVRPNTQAANLTFDVPKGEKERRHKAVLDLQKEISARISACCRSSICI